MSLQTQSWENTLLARAQEALQSHIPDRHTFYSDERALKLAFGHCNQVTHHHSKTFFMASGLLPYEKRQATRALYALCRVTDDIVDDEAPIADRRARLEQWRQIVMTPAAHYDNPVALAWANAQCSYGIPRGYAEQLIDGVARDLGQVRYETFEDLASYSYGVASTVGLMAMHIIGFESNEAIPYAVRLGVALQMTNILRDVAEDWETGRLYLPLDELAQFDLTEADVDAGCVDERWQAFVQYQIDRTRKLYDESWAGIQLLNRDGRMAIAAAADLYRAILGDIERHNYDVFARRAHVKNWGKVRRLPAIWWRANRTFR